MRFQKYLKRNTHNAYRHNYLDYSKLRELLKEAQQLSGKVSHQVPEDPPGIHNNAQRSQDTQTHEGSHRKQDSAEDRFLLSLDENVERVFQFVEVKFCELRRRLERLSGNTASSTTFSTAGENTGYKKNVRRLEKIHVLQNELRNFAEFIRINTIGFKKLAKKHDIHFSNKVYDIIKKKLISPSQLDDLLYEASRVILQNTKTNKERESVTTFIRRTDKYWVNQQNLTALKFLIIQHLPIYVYTDKDGDFLSSYSRETHDTCVSSVYFDNAQFELYSERLRKLHNSEAIRIRWYTSADPEIVFIERKKHEDGWTGEISKKLRFKIEERHVLPYINGDDVWCHVKRINGDETQALYLEIQKSIVEKKLQPVVRTFYKRSAFQLPNNSTVRLSLDTNLCMIRETSERVCVNREDSNASDSGNTQYWDNYGNITECSRPKDQRCKQSCTGDEAYQGRTSLHADSKQGTSNAVLDNSELGGVKNVNAESTRHSQSNLANEMYKASIDNLGHRNHSKCKSNMNYRIKCWRRPDVNCEYPFTTLKADEIVRFPHAILEIKSQSTDGEKPEWIEELINGPLVEHVHKFSKFIHGCAVLYPQISDIPYWLPQAHFSIRKDPFDTPYNPNYDDNFNADATCIDIPIDTEKLSPVEVHNKRIAIPVRVEPKVFFANERTFLSWVQFAIFLGGIGTAMLGLGNYRASMSGAGLIAVSIVFCFYALYLYHWRAERIRMRDPGPYDDLYGPMVLVCVFLVAMLFSVFFKFPLKKGY